MSKCERVKYIPLRRVFDAVAEFIHYLDTNLPTKTIQSNCYTTRIENWYTIRQRRDHLCPLLSRGIL